MAFFLWSLGEVLRHVDELTCGVGRMVLTHVHGAACSMDELEQLLTIDSGSAMTTCPYSQAGHIPVFRGNVRTKVGAGASDAL